MSRKTTVLPLEQVREIALKQYHGRCGFIYRRSKQSTFKKEKLVEKKLKKWTPHGYTRRVNKQIIKQLEDGEGKTGNKEDNITKKPKGVIDGGRSILEVQDINQVQNE